MKIIKNVNVMALKGRHWYLKRKVGGDDRWDDLGEVSMIQLLLYLTLHHNSTGAILTSSSRETNQAPVMLCFLFVPTRQTIIGPIPLLWRQTLPANMANLVSITTPEHTY